jgi:hypothetical protein
MGHKSLCPQATGPSLLKRRYNSTDSQKMSTAIVAHSSDERVDVIRPSLLWPPSSDGQADVSSPITAG